MRRVPFGAHVFPTGVALSPELLPASLNDSQASHAGSTAWRAKMP